MDWWVQIKEDSQGHGERRLSVGKQEQGVSGMRVPQIRTCKEDNSWEEKTNVCLGQKWRKEKLCKQKQEEERRIYSLSFLALTPAPPVFLFSPIISLRSPPPTHPPLLPLLKPAPWLRRSDSAMFTAQDRPIQQTLSHALCRQCVCVSRAWWKWKAADWTPASLN